jgi:hypothetical protein
MKHYLAALLLSTIALSAKSWEIDSGIGVGYRRDSQAFIANLLDLPDFLVYKENNKPLKGVALDGFFRVWVPYFLITGEGVYSWYVSGSLNNDPVIFDSADPVTSAVRTAFSYKNRGSAYDVYGAIGPVIPLAPKDYLRLVPEVGYGIDHQSLKRGTQSPEAFNGVLGGVVDFAFSFDLSRKRTKRTWWGPFVGAELFGKTKKSFQFEGGYFFHFLDLKQEMNPFLDLSASFMGMEVNHLLISPYFNGKLKKVYGQRVKGRAIYRITDRWNLSVFGNYLYFKSKKERATFSQESEDILIQPPTVLVETQQHLWKFWWHAFWVTLETSFFY